MKTADLTKEEIRENYDFYGQYFSKEVQEKLWDIAEYYADEFGIHSVEEWDYAFKDMLYRDIQVTDKHYHATVEDIIRYSVVESANYSEDDAYVDCEVFESENYALIIAYASFPNI